MKQRFKTIIDNDILFESIAENLYQETIDLLADSDGVYRDPKSTVKGKLLNVGNAVKKHVGKHKGKYGIGAATAALTGTYLYAHNKGKKEGIKKGRKEVLSKPF